MIAILLPLCSLAAAPPRPPPTAPVAGECPSAVAMVAGQTATCSGVLVPTSEALNLAADRAWAVALDQRYAIDLPAAQAQLDIANARVAELQKPPPFWQRPGVAHTAGIVEGMALVVLGAVAVEEAAKVGK